MKKKKILFLHSFYALKTLPSSYGKIIHDLNNEFKNFYIVNTDRLQMFFKPKIVKIKKSNYFKNIELFDPKNFNELEQFIDNDECLVINGISRRLEYFSIYRYLTKKKIPQIIISNLGHIQPSDYYYKGLLKHKINHVMIRTIPYFLHNILVFFKFFSKIDIRFISNKILYNQIALNSSSRKFSHIKKFVLVNSLHYESEIYKKKNKQKHILLLELPPDYKDVSEILGKFSETELNIHYLKLNSFLSKLKKLYKKKVIVSISPKYNFKQAKHRFKNFKIVNFDVEKYIREAFLVVFYDSSVILYAALSKKPIINITSEIYKKRNFTTNHYNRFLNLKEINIYDNISFTKKGLMNDLNMRVKSYKKFFQKYLPPKKNSGNAQIIKIIKKKYF